jgi:hypothetical protein
LSLYFGKKIKLIFSLFFNRNVSPILNNNSYFLIFYIKKHILFIEKWFGKDWREVYLVLHEDSTLSWYSERGESSPQGGLVLKDSPEMIAAGQVLK